MVATPNVRRLSGVQRRAMMSMLNRRRTRWEFHGMTRKSLLDRGIARKAGDRVDLTIGGREAALTMREHG